MTPTTSELRAAWQAMRLRPAFAAWPPEFNQVMADPVRCKLVAFEASARVRRALPHTNPAKAPPAPAKAAGAALTQPYLPVHLDRKRAAAGERDD